MPILGPNGMPVRQSRAIPDEILAQVLSDHETRLNALAAQQVHLGIMVEYLTDRLQVAVPELEIDPKEFAEYRTVRFEEMKKEALAVAKARQRSIKAADAVATEPPTVLDDMDLDLTEIDMDLDDIG